MTAYIAASLEFRPGITSWNMLGRNTFPRDWNAFTRSQRERSSAKRTLPSGELIDIVMQYGGQKADDGSGKSINLCARFLSSLHDKPQARSYYRGLQVKQQQLTCYECMTGSIISPLL